MDEAQPQDSRPRNQASEIIVSGHIWSAVWYLAWPTAINTLIQTAYGVINLLFVGKLHNATQALAAIGIGNVILMIQFGMVVGLSVGTSALVSRFLGARQHNDADEATGQSLVLAVIAGAISGLPLILLAGPIVTVVGAQPNVAPLAADYTAIISWFSIPTFVYFIITAALRSAGDVITLLYAGAAVISLNVILDWILIYGVGPFPSLGVHGAAISTGISRVVGMLAMLWFLNRSVLKGSLRHVKVHRGWFGRIIRIGWPASVQNLLWSTASAVFVMILGLLPASRATAAQAALTVALRIEAFAFMPGLAYSTAATPLVGQNLGAGKPDRAEHSAWVATLQAVMIMATVAVVFMVIPRWLALAFTREAAVVPLIVAYLRINAVSEPFLAVGMVLRGALQGAGETLKPMAVTVGTLWLLRLPLAWALVLPLGLGAVGAWIAMATTTILSGLLMAALFKWGRWQSTRV